ncbi:MAG: YdcF family protein, partial [Brevundimonas sp.]|nr:YdcF family protein [Brevundimonas sp.]
DYHMPRALTEIRAAAPGVELTPYAVETPSLDNSRWWKAAVTARRMTLEYMKYLTALARASVGGGRPAASEAAADTPTEKAA